MKNRGFTLIELLAVLVILIIILTLTVPAVMDMVEKSDAEVFKNNIEAVIRQVDLNINEGEYPAQITEDGTVTDLPLEYTGNINTLEFKNSSKWTGTWSFRKEDGVITLFNASDGKYTASLVTSEQKTSEYEFVKN